MSHSSHSTFSKTIEELNGLHRSKMNLQRNYFFLQCCCFLHRPLAEPGWSQDFVLHPLPVDCLARDPNSSMIWLSDYGLVVHGQQKTSMRINVYESQSKQMLTNIKPLSTMLLHPSEEWKQVIDVRNQRWMAHPNFIIFRIRNFTPCISMYVYMICVRIDAVCVILSLIDLLQLKVANIFYCTCLNLNEPPLVEKTAHRCFSEDGDHPLDQPPRRKDKKGSMSLVMSPFAGEYIIPPIVI